MDKFNREYELSVQTRTGETITFRRPFTVEFDIHRNSFSSANVAMFRIYNLAPNSRDKIRKDQYEWGDNRKVAFLAGYNPANVFKIDEKPQNLSLAFAGNITQAWSVREGTNMVTQIECYDAGFAYVNAITNRQAKAGSQQTTIIDDLLQDLKNAGVEKGKVGNYTGQISRGNSFTGSTVDILREISGGGFFIDNGKAHVLKDDEALEGPISLIDAKSGLLGTPIREQTYLNFDMLFEPRLIIGQRLKLESSTASFFNSSTVRPNFNGDYKVVSLKHTGIISESVSGSAITSVGLSFGPEALSRVD